MNNNFSAEEFVEDIKKSYPQKSKNKVIVKLKEGTLEIRSEKKITKEDIERVISSPSFELHFTMGKDFSDSIIFMKPITNEKELLKKGWDKIYKEGKIDKILHQNFKFNNSS